MTTRTVTQVLEAWFDKRFTKLSQEVRPGVAKHFPNWDNLPPSARRAMAANIDRARTLKLQIKLDRIARALSPKDAVEYQQAWESDEWTESPTAALPETPASALPKSVPQAVGAQAAAIALPQANIYELLNTVNNFPAPVAQTLMATTSTIPAAAPDKVSVLRIAKPSVLPLPKAAEGITKAQVLEAFEGIVKPYRLAGTLKNGQGLFGPNGARTQKGTPGGRHDALWDPVNLAHGLLDKKLAPLPHMKRAFKEHPFLKKWTEKWNDSLRFLDE
jgi:hypothetical protein